MSDVRDSLGRVGYDLLSRALTDCGREWFTGEVRVTGRPGGSFHLRDGLVVAVESPGAPGPEALLLRSGRIDGDQWAELVRESGGARWPEAGLVAHGYAGAAQLRVVCMLALQDAAFAIVAGRIDSCERVPGTEPVARVPVGEGPLRLLQDSVRRLAAVSSLPYPVRPDRERPLPAAELPQVRLGELQRELLDRADGRSTARDLAFRSGRGVYAVTVEVGRMLAAGLLECPDPAAPAPVRILADTHAVRHREPPPPPPPYGPPEPPGDPVILPRRTPGASGITEALTPQKAGASWKGFFRMRSGTAR
ncbi:MarR family transcriptional regulator [Streptomyces sp. NPDC090306]|uniref:MarR family transcriptional regulator n=1 Tax=Streptomyces sp. NPDC090306 TaxID=3365961 RepID=UPI00382CA1E2